MTARMDKWIHSVVVDGIKKGKITENEAEIYEFGYTLMIEKLYIFLISVVIAIVLDAVWEVFTLCIAFIPLRVYSGGYHAKSRWGCMMLSGAFLIFGVIIARRIKAILNVCGFIIVELVCGIILIKYAPVDVKQRKLSDSEQCYFKKISTIIAAIETLIGILFFCCQKDMVTSIIAISSIFNSCAMCGKFLFRHEMSI